MAELYQHSHCTQLTYNSNNAAPNNVDLLGDIWVDIDATLGVRKFAFVKNSGATTAAIASGNVVVFTDSYGMIVSTHIADSARNLARGVGQSAISIGYSGWIQTEGYHSAIFVDGSSFSKGDWIMMSNTDLEGTVSAAGTAPVYTTIGVALGASTGGGQKTVAGVISMGKLSYHP